MTTAREPGRDQVAALAGVAAPLALTAILIPFRAGLPNTDAALALILVVVALAAAGYRPGGMLAAVSAAAWFDFFLTVPYERFTITRHADIETTALILAVGIAVTEIAVRGRRQHTAAARRAGYLDGINAAARAVATGTEPQLLIDQVCGQLTPLLGLAACRFQDGAAGIGNPPRLLRDGRFVTAGQTWDTWHAGLPPGRDTELLAEAAACCRAGSCSPPARRPAEPGAAAGRRRPGRPGRGRTGRRPPSRPPLSRQDSPGRPGQGTGRCAGAGPRDVMRQPGRLALPLAWPFPEAGQLAARLARSCWPALCGQTAAVTFVTVPRRVTVIRAGVARTLNLPADARVPSGWLPLDHADSIRRPHVAGRAARPAGTVASAARPDRRRARGRGRR